MSQELDSLQTLFLGLMTIFGGIAATFGIFILKKLDCFQTIANSIGNRVTALETKAAIYHPPE